MIKNNKQLEVTKQRIDEFNKALIAIANKKEEEITHPILQKAQIEAINSTLEELNEEVKIYESLRDNQLCSIKGGNFEDISRILIQARIAKGWTQSQLAREVGWEPQQIQRYEATDYEGVGLARVQEIVYALEIDFTIKNITVCKEQDGTDVDELILILQKSVRERGELFQMVA